MLFQGVPPRPLGWLDQPNHLGRHYVPLISQTFDAVPYLAQPTASRQLCLSDISPKVSHGPLYRNGPVAASVRTFSPVVHTVALYRGDKTSLSGFLLRAPQFAWCMEQRNCSRRSECQYFPCWSQTVNMVASYITV